MDLRLSDPRVQPVAGIVSPKPEQADEILELPARTLLEFAATNRKIVLNLTGDLRGAAAVNRLTRAI